MVKIFNLSARNMFYTRINMRQTQYNILMVDDDKSIIKIGYIITVKGFSFRAKFDFK